MASPSLEPADASRRPTAAEQARNQHRSQPERALLAIEILAAYARARWALRSAPIAEVVAGLRSAFPDVSPTVNTLKEARQLGHAVRQTLPFIPGDTRCLARSLVLTRLLARRGIAAKLVIGARTDPEFLAHAWVEHDGNPVLTPGDGTFARLVEL